tara:strand:+ start:19 stop:933 length:915 start_codon:yes stop_codon:yes gene_type:complete
MKKFNILKKDFLEFLKYEKGYSNNTIQAYRRDITKFLIFLTEESVHYNKVTKEVIFSFQKAFFNEFSSRTFARTISSLRSFNKYLFYKEAIDEGILKIFIDYPTPKIQKKIPSFINEEQFYKILENIEQSKKSTFQKRIEKLIIILFFTTGIRLAEASNLKLSDIFLEDKRIKVLGKGSKERIVPINNHLKEHIVDYLKKAGKYPLKSSQLNNNLFVDKHNKNLSRDKIQRMVINNLKGFSVDSFGPHTLRHSFATFLLENDVQLETVRALLGHESIKSTQIYSHVTLSSLQEAIKKAHPRGKK